MSLLYLQAVNKVHSLRRTATEDAYNNHTQSYTLWDIVFARVFDYTNSRRNPSGLSCGTDPG